jgi:hypothetical protein
MPLASGSSRKTISKNVAEMMRSRTFGAGHSKAKRAKMAAAAAYRNARESAGRSSLRGRMGKVAARGRLRHLRRRRAG